MLERMIGLLLFFNMGFAPVSQAKSRVIIKWDLNLLFIVSGILVVLATIWTDFQPDFKTFCGNLTTEITGD